LRNTDNQVNELTNPAHLLGFRNSAKRTRCLVIVILLQGRYKAKTPPHKIITMTESSAIINEIHSLIKDWEPRLVSLTNETIVQHRNSQNRTIKQILGHLIDSTSNNSQTR